MPFLGCSSQMQAIICCLDSKSIEATRRLLIAEFGLRATFSDFAGSTVRSDLLNAQLLKGVQLLVKESEISERIKS